ncbi:hypothetical protein QVD17_20132 [Tagetes erecta]|uniref:Zinc finger MYM-type protein 1 n=1 Tax=Tagetes erecta TaxID=13708 RepID=A0AAD8KL77_TARER|nr:hypothetical protein QVD17_20132 [Tagetes erecta]
MKDKIVRLEEEKETERLEKEKERAEKLAMMEQIEENTVTNAHMKHQIEFLSLRLETVDFQLEPFGSKPLNKNIVMIHLNACETASFGIRALVFQMALRGGDYFLVRRIAERGNDKSNGNFLGLIEMLEEFDPVIKEHVRRITSDKVHVHYLGHNIQNELILLLAQEIKNEIIKRIKEAKYYSIILDCTPDASHQEQMTLIVRYVNISSTSIIVEESFLGFLNVNDTTGEGLFDITLEELKSLGLEIDDMRGQGYDNGANMKGQNKGVQSRFLAINPRAFYTPCGCHSLNLTLCDMANCSDKEKKFFGLIQRIYTIFANSINRWEILKDNVKTWSLKPLSQTRWESRVESVKAIRMQLRDVREALLQVGEQDKDAAISSEANSLAEKDLSEFEFLVTIVVWYNVLNHMNIVSKKLQSKDMHLESAIKEINTLMTYFKDYRENGYLNAIEEAKEIASEMGIDPVFTQKRVIKRKKRFDESSSTQEASFTPEEDFRVKYFIFIVDQAITSLDTRFEQFKEFEKLFGFLFPCILRGIEDKELKLSCQLLENALKFEDKSDIDAHELYMELKLLNTTNTGEFKNPLDVLKHLKEVEYFPNASIAYRVLLTIPVTVASAERSFSKLKLLKSYLRSTMSQQRLSGLAQISIENEILDNINCEDVINQFAMKNARRASRLIVRWCLKNGAFFPDPHRAPKSSGPALQGSMSLVDESRDQEMPRGVESSVGVDRDKSWRWVVHQGCRVKTKESIPTYGMQTLNETELEFYVRDKSFGEEEYPFNGCNLSIKKV